MRNIPVDLSKFTFVCVSPSRSRVASWDTGEVTVDYGGNTVYQVSLSAVDRSGRVELLNVSLIADPGISIGQVVVPIGLVASPWEQAQDGRVRWGVAYRADQVVPAASADFEQKQGRKFAPTSARPSALTTTWAAGVRNVQGLPKPYRPQAPTRV